MRYNGNLKLCLHCMCEIDGLDDTCPHCGKAIVGFNAENHQLNPLEILKNKYLIGSALVDTGNYISYIALDLAQMKRVVVKEFYPRISSVFRDNSYSPIIKVNHSTENDFNALKIAFSHEAKLIERGSVAPGTAQFLDLIEENNTSYIVMEYIEGQLLHQYLKTYNKRISADVLLQLMKPVIHSMHIAYERGIVHCDICPQNILFAENGLKKLLDSGSLYDISHKDKKMSWLIHEGYSPIELYSTHGMVGAWTVVYSICATMYRCLTGMAPLESIERTYQDTLLRPRDLGADITSDKEAVLMKGMEIYPENRYQSIERLYNALYD